MSSARVVMILLAIFLAGCTGATVTQPNNTVPPPTATNATRCPNRFPALPSGQMMDLCSWSRTSDYGDYASVLHDVRHYDSCPMWKAEFQRWINAGRPENSPPGGVGRMVPVFVSSTKTLETSPVKGKWHVEVSFHPVRAKSLITIIRPEWSGMSDEQRQRVDMIMTQLLPHERGHQNLAGRLATAYKATFEVAGNQTARQAEDFVKNTFGSAQENALDSAIKVVRKRYDDLTQDGASQSVLGGTDVPSVICGQISLTSSFLQTSVKIGIQCETAPQAKLEITSEYSVYQPLPSSFKAIKTSSTTGCDPVPQQSVDVPGTLPTSGEYRSVSDSLSGGRTIGIRTDHEEASANISGTYTYDHTTDNSSLRFSGKFACDSLWQDTNVPSSADGNRPLSRGVVQYHFTIDGSAQISVELTGHWPDFYPNNSATIHIAKKLPQSWADYFNASSLGTPYTKTLQSGTYEFSFTLACGMAQQFGGSVDKHGTGEVEYMITVLS